MSQQTNLNVSPYFDDFDANNQYYKVLFKPGYPVQSRELTTIQSILQHQIEKFGQHFFKDGSKVIPGNTFYSTNYQAVELENTYLGVPVSSYIDQIVGSTIRGVSSGITAVVDKVLFPQDSERGNLTLYVNYTGTSTVDNFSGTFFDSELLVSDSIVFSQLLGTSTIPLGEPFASTISRNATSRASAFSINDGIYYIRGYFVTVKKETLILDQYSDKPNYRIGFYVNEEIVTSDIDENLNDNSQGFNNYSAPGADRLKISVSLFKKSLTDTSDDNFIELGKVENGLLSLKSNVNTDYNLLSDEFARRTYEESGDYYIKPFDIKIRESLDDRMGNNGVYGPTNITENGSIPSDNLSLYQLSPGKAYVRGYEINILNNSLIDVPKPRTTKTLENQSIVYNTGATFRVNRVFGSPLVGIGNTYVLSLRDSRVGSAQSLSPGKEIGVARVYDFALESGSYNPESNANANQWDICLYDVQTTTEVTINESITLSVPTFIKGNSSGATAFLKQSVSNSKSLILYQTVGEFSLNESLTFDGVDGNRVAIAVTSYGISDVKSVYGVSPNSNIFTADVIQTPKYTAGISSISAAINGVSVITTADQLFPQKITKLGEIVKYTDPRYTVPVYGKVVNIGLANTSISISGVATVSGVVQGNLPSTSLTVSDLEILTTRIISSSDDTLFTKLPRSNVSNVNLTNANITIRKSYTVNIISNQLQQPVIADENETFLPFDEEYYFLIRSDGATEPLTEDKVKLSTDSKELTIKNLGANNTGATLVATLRKIKPKEKVKKKNRVNTLIINKSKNNQSGLEISDGLTYGNYPYGTRVQDEIISLNYPDILEVHGIYESSSSSTPSAPKLTLSSITGPNGKTSDLIVGEKIIGSISNSVAIVAEKTTDSEITFIYKNNVPFNVGESIFFEESRIQAVIVSINQTDFNVTSNYVFNSGQKGSMYDYGTITRKSIYQEPTKQLKIYFSNAYYDSTDDGDITTINSYVGFDYKKDFLRINGIRTSDIIDIRPRVSTYNVIENSPSPLEFNGRTFNQAGNSAANSLASDESINIDFSFFLGRIDRIYLNKNGILQVKYGVPSEKPEKPVSVDDALEIGYVTLPPFLYNISDVSIKLLEHKRYRMSDIKMLEDRIKNLEYYTSLSLLESSTANLVIQDSNNLNRFKSGFFVDNFTDTRLIQDGTYNIKNSIDIRNQELRPSHHTTNISLIPNSSFSINIRQQNGGAEKKVVMLDYSEVEWKKQSIATRSESVTPFITNYWNGFIELTPSSDDWVEEPIVLSDNIISVDDVYNLSSDVYKPDSNGILPTEWGSWTTNWRGNESGELFTRSEDIGSTYEVQEGDEYVTYQDVSTISYKEGYETRSGSIRSLSFSPENYSLGEKVISNSQLLYMRSRNIQFVSKNIKPNSEVAPYFNSQIVSNYCFPKLLQIQMITGKFGIGDEITGTSSSGNVKFKILRPNHKYDTPQRSFNTNPYNPNLSLESDYSETSSILNIDTESLCDINSDYYGCVVTGMTLTNNNGATAIVLDTKLVSDDTSTLIGIFFVPPQTFNTGTSTFKLMSSDTSAEEIFISSGYVETIQEDIISIKSPRFDLISSPTEERDTDQIQQVGDAVITKTVISRRPVYYPSYSSSPDPAPSPSPGRSAPGSYIDTRGQPPGMGYISSGYGAGQTVNVDWWLNTGRYQ